MECRSQLVPVPHFDSVESMRERAGNGLTFRRRHDFSFCFLTPETAHTIMTIKRMLIAAKRSF